MNTVHVIILAGGKGTRMQSELPKVLLEVAGKPIIGRVLDAVEASGVLTKPTVVVGFKHQLVEAYVANRANTILQEEQLGTGHAVKISKSVVPISATAIIILYGDHPLISATMIQKLARMHAASNNTVTMALATVPDFDDWRSAFTNFGRIIRDKYGIIVRSREVKDASPEELLVKEVNPCYFCFNADWMWRTLDKVSNDNAQHEYYLPDLIQIAYDEARAVGSVQIDPHEALGVNTKEQLHQVEQYILKHSL